MLVLAVLGFLAAESARADDACLTGPSTLGDQRALATLRADDEIVCPCATATSRSGYRRCAKTLIGSSVVGGTLREACQPTARKLFKSSTCGTKRATCGRVQPAASTPVSCRVKAASACADRPKYDQTACTDESYCADVIEWTAGTCSDVRLRGPYEAGVQTITMTKQSVVDPTQPRVLDTVVWYPTTPGSGPIDGATGGVLNASLDGSGGPYPVLLFSHGSCGYPLQSTFLLPLIASRGYVVIAPPHPGTPSSSSRAAGRRPRSSRRRRSGHRT